jgi:hypothetical protein
MLLEKKSLGVRGVGGRGNKVQLFTDDVKEEVEEVGHIKRAADPKREDVLSCCFEV